VPEYRPNRQERLIMVRPIVQQLSHRRVRRRRVQRTTLLDLARRSAAPQQRAMMCLVHRALRRRPVRHVQRPPRQQRPSLKMHRIRRPLGKQRRVPRTRPGRRRTLLGMKVRPGQKTLRIKKHRLGQRPLRVRRMHHIRRPLLVKQHPVPRTRHVLKPKLVRRLLPDRKLKLIQRRKRLVRKNADSSSARPVSTRDGS